MRYPTFSRFDTIPECDRHTHTQTGRRHRALKMTVDEFGGRETDDRSGVSFNFMHKSFVRRDGGNTGTGSIDMTGNTLNNVAFPTSEQDVATKTYVDSNSAADKVSKSGDTMTCLLYTSPSPRDRTRSRMPSSA